ncbi:hypothetical protein FHS52_002430 [Erythromicrobium ramosum]|uniref:DUF3761 domain-containing protein n=1 Tax=Erythrobacter ramosus TaxID=35811 RepID=A0A6I4UHS2_9SPHN|nr:hypothetical protein [Erythrobacter ramosus]MBB3776461.1 hypothetical protein [Erythrobacter ramosus]MXP38460.1 hypothetical protein [Erythrobacter ramosus]
MKMITTLAAGAAMAFAAIPFASPAMAQGAEGKFPVPRAGCPKTHVTAKRSPDTVYYCYPKKVSNDDSSSSSSSGSSGGPVYTDPTFGNLTKASEYDRCPVGYHTSDSARTTCVSYHEGKSPASRLKKGGACAADEVDEWGVWCTSKSTTLTRAQAEDEAISDVNIIFAPEGRGATQGPEYQNTPGILAIFGPKGGAQASNAAASSGDQAAAQQTAQCPAGSGSASGAAIGGAIGGDAGAVLGGMLGGLGKKKKKAAGC